MHKQSSGIIEVIGAGENNLRGIDVSIPKGELVVFAGVSGSGKSSLVFDTLAVESSREWQESFPLFVRNKMPHYERPSFSEIRGLTPSIVIRQGTGGDNSRSTVGTFVDAAPLLRLLFSRFGEPSAGGSMAYNPNHPAGMCPECSGLGESLELMEDSMFDTSKSLNEGAILFSQFSAGWQASIYQNNSLLDSKKKLADFSPQEWQILKYGTPGNIEIRSNDTGQVWKVDYEGVIPRFKRLYLQRDISKLKKSLQDEIRSHVHQAPCRVCNGTGLNPKAIASRINDRNIIDCQNMTAEDLLHFLDGVSNPLAQILVNQLAGYLRRMIDVGAGYLSLGRKTSTVSGGEAQRLKIVRSIGGSLNNITYIFDEPTAGLHPHDAQRIGAMLCELRDKENNVLVVEHNRQMIELADHVIELGPEAGSRGGRITFQGSVDELRKAKTVTGECLREKLTVNHSPRSWSEGYSLKDAHSHNLQHVDVIIPKGVLTVVSGVAGSGKSSLICSDFVKAYPEAIVIDQKPIGTSIRSTPATYTGAMDEIRKLFARENGVSAGWFSFNSEGGCPICKGTGQITYDMAFAEPLVVVCEECGGRRYNPKALEYKYHGLNIEEVMSLTIEEAVNFFGGAKIKSLLGNLLDVGLGYMTLGQPTSTLSGGEVQRVKLAGHLNRKGGLYVLDEPASGLHSRDIKDLLALLNRLVDDGNTVIVIEHHPEIIASADWVIDLGPDGGSNGGRIIFAGTPEDLLNCRESKTGQFLQKGISQ